MFKNVITIRTILSYLKKLNDVLLPCYATSTTFLTSKKKELTVWLLIEGTDASEFDE